MQGQQLKIDLDRLMAERHITDLHGEGSGYITFCRKSMDGKFEQRHFRYDELADAMDYIIVDEPSDYYNSINTFYIPARKLENLREINALYADLDCHHLSKKKAKDEIKASIRYFLEQCVYERIPMPSTIVNTGRGLQIYWILYHLPKQALPKWQMAQGELTKRLEETVISAELDLMVDNVSDISRVFRTPGTFNTKAQAMATTIFSESHKYRLGDLIDEYFPELLEVCDYKPRKKRNANTPENTVLRFKFNLYSLHYARLQDLVKIQELRKGDVESDECRRRMVFLYRYWNLCFTGDVQEALEAVLDFNRRFTHPLPESVVKTATASAEKAYREWLTGAMVEINGQAYRKGYNYRNSTLIKWLGITPKEQRELQTIISTEEKYRRKNEKRTGRDGSGMTAKQRERLERDMRILDMRNKGLSYSAIGELLGINKSTVCRAIERSLHF